MAIGYVESEEDTKEQEAILRKELPRIINDVTMLINRPFRLVWDPTIQTASTDCLSEIRIAPRPFLEGEREVGYGTVYHETGHIRFSPYGSELMATAHKKGGESLQSIMNIILDRKDDSLTAEHAPGFKDLLRKRLLVIRTLTRRERYKEILKDYSLKEQSQILRNFKPQDVFEDFFLAAKCGKTPRLRKTWKAMKFVRIEDLRNASTQELLFRAEKVQEILRTFSEEQEGDGSQNGRPNPEKAFTRMCKHSEVVVTGIKLDPEIDSSMKNFLAQYLGALRKNGLQKIIQKLNTETMVHPGPISTGLTEKVRVVKVKPRSENLAVYNNIFQEVSYLVNPMIKTLRNISSPSEFELYGQDDGELDLTEVGRIACGLSGHFKETIIERDIDAEIHLAIDTSGSMYGGKVHKAKQLAVVFTEAISAISPSCKGNIWSFNSLSIEDYGETSKQSGFVNIEGRFGNSDTHMLEAVSKKLLRSTKKRRLLFVLCDDGPDDIEAVQRLTRQLAARGMIIVHLLVGVHGSPDIYPIELLYDRMEDCLEEFGDLLKTIIEHLK
jgi:hypothetical protein